MFLPVIAISFIRFKSTFVGVTAKIQEAPIAQFDSMFNLKFGGNAFPILIDTLLLI